MAGSKKLKTALLYVLAFVVLIIMVFPYLYMILSSLAPWEQVDRKIIPTKLTLRSYEWLFTGGDGVVPRPWLRAFFNSIFVTLSSTVLMLVTAILVGYSLAKLKFKGSRFLNKIGRAHV